MWYLILYVIIGTIFYCIGKRVLDSHTECSFSEDAEFFTNNDVLMVMCVFWAPVICIALPVGIIYLIYRVIDYVVGKLYSKIISIADKKDTSTKKGH